VISQPGTSFASMAALRLGGRLGEVDASGGSGAGSIAQQIFDFTRNHKFAITLTLVVAGGWLVWFMRQRRSRLGT